MEIVKQNENYQITDNQEGGWKMVGSASKQVGGAISVNFSVSTEGELMESIGDCSYYKDDNGRASVSYNVAESNRDAFVAYTDTVVDTLLEHFTE